MSVVSRADRDAAAELIVAFQEDRIDHSQEETWERLCASHDPTVRHALDVLLDATADYFPGDPIEKSEWDLLERVRLVLLSDATLTKTRTFTFTWHDAALLLASIAALLAFASLGFLWYIAFGLCAVVPLWILRLRILQAKRLAESPYIDLIEPFTSIRQLREVYRRTPAFRKHICPREKRDREPCLVVGLFSSLLLGLVVVLIPPFLAVMVLISAWEPQYRVAN